MMTVTQVHRDKIRVESTARFFRRSKIHIHENADDEGTHVEYATESDETILVKVVARLLPLVDPVLCPCPSEIHQYK